MVTRPAVPEPGSEEHDNICRFLMQEEVARQVVRAAGLSDASPIRFATEVPIIERRSNTYAMCVGFADLVIRVGHPYELHGTTFFHTRSKVVVEVKSGRVVVGEVLRQLKTYQGCLFQSSEEEKPRMVLVAAKLAPEQIAHLQKAGVTPIVLGLQYAEWRAPGADPALVL